MENDRAKFLTWTDQFGPMNDELSPVEKSLLQLWRDHYPFLYWANRINKINPLNPHDKLEAIFTLLQLSDTYVTNLVATLQNPNEPWYFVKERAYSNQINDILGQFESAENERIDLRNFNNDLDNITSFTPRDGWEVSTSGESRKATPLDVFAFTLLGCPAIQNTEENRLQFQENPETYIEVCNGIINFRQNWWPLLNDLKHGFRLLPFEWEALENLEPMYVTTDRGFDLSEKKEEYEATKEDYVYFWRLEGKASQDVDLGLYVYRIELRVCTVLSRTINFLLHNLIRTNPVSIFEKIEPVVDESGQVDTFEVFLPSTMLTES